LHFAFLEAAVDSDGLAFKRILLNRCQRAFEEGTLMPQQDNITDIDADERAEIELKNKLQVLGNFKFIGALLVQGMISTKILLRVIVHLLREPTAGFLECLAVFLTAVGPTFDRKEWDSCNELCRVFEQVEELSAKQDLPARTRYLLKDVLDLRASGWKKLSRPNTR